MAWFSSTFLIVEFYVCIEEYGLHIPTVNFLQEICWIRKEIYRWTWSLTHNGMVFKVTMYCFNLRRNSFIAKPCLAIYIRMVVLKSSFYYDIYKKSLTFRVSVKPCNRRERKAYTGRFCVVPYCRFDIIIRFWWQYDIFLWGKYNNKF